MRGRAVRWAAAGAWAVAHASASLTVIGAPFQKESGPDREPLLDRTLNEPSAVYRVTGAPSPSAVDVSKWATPTWRSWSSGR